MSLLIVGLGVCLLLVLMVRFHLNAFLALIIVALLVGVAEGMTVHSSLKAVTEGLGSTLGSLALILAFGAMLGKLVEESGAAHKIAYSLIHVFGEKKMQWAVLLTSFIVGIPMIYNAGFLVIIPLLYTIASAAKKPLLYLGIPMCSALSVAHGLLPPHPAPSAIAVLYEADINMTLVYGLLISLPALVIAGPLFSTFFKKVIVHPPEGLYKERTFKPEELPGLGISLLITLFPVLLMLLGVVADLNIPETSPVHTAFKFIGDPNIALLLAVLFGIYFLGIRLGRKIKEVMNSLSGSVASIAMILLIIAAGGAFKEVLLRSGVSEYIKVITSGTSLSPLLLAWCVSAVIRMAIGSAQVAAITASGIVLPLLQGSGIRPELMVLATSSGSLMFSHVNDIGFWMFKEYFNLSIKQTFLSWTIMETIVSVTGLIGVLILNMFL